MLCRHSALAALILAVGTAIWPLAAADSGPVIRDFLILSSNEDRERIATALDDPSLRARPADTSAMSAAHCASAWWDDIAELADCVQAQMPEQAKTVLFYSPLGRRGADIELTCIGPSQVLEVILASKPSPSDAAVLDACLALAEAEAAAADLAVYGIRSGELLPAVGDRARLAEAAASVLTVAVDHVGQPRGIRGQCLVWGRIVAVRRGAAHSARGRVEFGLPCSAGRSPDDGQRIAMGELFAGSYADIYLDRRQNLLEYRRLDR